ncbi:MAG TPA: CusA/CzcA family heavy metal efflux RND transporter [Acidobacteriaceae bacterium]
MINRIVQFALRQRFLVLMMVVFLAIGGILSFSRMPVDAYPDLSPPMVEIITQWPGHAAEEVERLVTVPTEVEMNGVPKMTVMRSISLYGLSDIILTFHDETDDYWAREVVFQRLSEVTYPTGVTPTLAPLASPSGLVYRYVIQSPDRTPQELKVYEDWVIERQYKQVPGVADDSGFGGTVMQYQVLLDPAKLYAYHITVPAVVQQLSVNNSNAGGGFYSQGGQFYYVRGLGLIRDTSDISNVVVGSQNGVPVRIGDIGSVTIGHAPRLGEFGFNKTDDAVEGVIMMRRGEQTQNVLRGVEAKTAQLNQQILPPDIKIHPYYDRSDLVQLTIDTVEHNMVMGMILVLIVLICFLVSLRAAIIVALTIPLSLLFSFIFLHAQGVAANLLSIGAIDFGILIDGTLVMVENIFRVLGEREGTGYNLMDVIVEAARDVDRPIFYSVAVIIAGYLPIYALSGPSGKLFRPMADTVSIALVGSLILTLTFVPIMCWYWFKKGVHERVNKPFEWVRRKYAGELEWCLDHPKITMAVATAIFAATLLLVPFIGGEFMPHLDEGALWIRATLPYTISFEEASRFSPQVRDILMQYPMVTDVGSELGRPDDGTDPTGFFNDEFYVGLKPYNDPSWRSGPIRNKQQLQTDIQKKLDTFPGVIFNYTQPAEDAVDEALTGLKSALAVKIYGPDLNVLQGNALEIKRRLEHVPGFTELTVVRELGQPSLLIDVDRDKIARYGINVADVEALVQAAVGGQAATQVIQGEKLFDLVVRMEPQFRENAREIGNLLVGAPSGQQIPLSELANIHDSSGASFIYRENNSRYIGVQYSVEGRDLQSAVNEGQRAIAAITRSLPPGYRIAWGGEYGELLEAEHQMEIIGPLALLIIFIILFALYDNFKFPVTIALGVVLTEPVGALIALKLTHTPFSVSSALGLLALMGVSVETAVILVSYINKLRRENKDIRTATMEASLLRLRPIMMTALVACLGLLPAALSTGIGSDTQKPFAIVIVAGLISRLFLGFFVNPVLYEMVARDGDVLKV